MESGVSEVRGSAVLGAVVSVYMPGRATRVAAQGPHAVAEVSTSRLRCQCHGGPVMANASGCRGERDRVAPTDPAMRDTVAFGSGQA